MKIKHIIKITITVVIIVGMLAVTGCTYNHKPLPGNTVTLKKCVDGDTARFMIDGKNTSVRFLDIDTPETVKPNTPVQPYGKEASNYTCSALQSAKSIKLEYEDKNKLDKYGRTLAWVFIDNKLLQSEILQQGLGRIRYAKPTDKYLGILKRDQAQAKRLHKGIWSQR